MNIVYLIGNGFDLSLNMKTSYPHFYGYYCDLKDKEQNKNVLQLKNSIKQGQEDWKDLELQFGQYTTHFQNVSELQEVVFNLMEHLRFYLKDQQEKVSAEELDAGAFINYLARPEDHSNAVDAANLERSFPADKGDRSISIISFNYTNTIEKIADRLGKVKGVDSVGNVWRYQGIYHIHGTLENNILLGVNDVSQISNTELAKDQDCLDLIVKPESNANSIKNNVDGKSKNLISKADVIVLFGLSIGETDQLWWQEIGTRLLHHGAQLVIFSYEKDCIGGNKGLLIGSRARKVRKRFLTLSGLEGKEEEWRDRIFVEINSNMFRGIRQDG